MKRCGIGGVHLDVEHVDAGEFLEQHRLAFHHRLAGERPDGAEAEHRGAVGNDADQVGARGVEAGGGGVRRDRLAGGGDARRVGQRQIVLRRHALDGLDGDFPGPRQPVIVQRGLAEIVVHLWRPGAAGGFGQT